MEPVTEALTPEARARRSFVYRKLLDAGARFVDANDAAVANTFAGDASEIDTARQLGLTDLSPLRRVGFKGPGAAEWLGALDVSVPAVNRAARQADGSLVLRLGANDIMIVTDLASSASLPERLLQAWDALENPPREPRGFPVPRQEGFCWFALTGSRADAVMAKLCGVDLRAHKFADGEIAQTSVARLSAVVARNDIGNTHAYYLYADSASAEYWWDCFIDAMREFAGRPVGLVALRALPD
ncbi:MAG: hypothetical protein ACT4NU_10580 [Chromatiales bacterium]